MESDEELDEIRQTGPVTLLQRVAFRSPSSESITAWNGFTDIQTCSFHCRNVNNANRLFKNGFADGSDNR